MAYFGSFIGRSDLSKAPNISQPTHAEIAPLSAWKIHERIAKASDSRIPIEAGNHIEPSNMKNRTGPAMSAPNRPAVAASGLSLSINVPAFHEPNRITHDPASTAAR